MARLKIRLGSTELGERHVHHFECAYQVNDIPYLELSIRDGDIALETFDRADSDDFAPGAQITLHGGVDDAENLLFSGIVTQSCVAIVKGETKLTITAKGKAVNLLEHPVNFMSNTEITDDALIKKVASLSGTYAFNDVSSIAKNKIKHSQFAVCQQTPWRIIFARMLENGAVFCPSPDGDDLVTLAELKPVDAGEPFALRRVHECHMHVDTQSVIKTISANAWDLKTQALVEAKAAVKGEFKEWDGAETVLNRKPLSLSMTEPLTKPQLQARAQGEASFRLLDQCQGHVTVTQDSINDVAKLALLNKMKVKGVGEKFAEDNLITGIRHRFSSSDWFIDIEFGLPLAKTLYNEASYLSAMPVTMGKIAAFKAYDKLSNTLPVIVPAIDPVKPLYARLLTPFASKEEGFFFQPAKDDEVMLTFVGGNASYPIIVGSCHNETNIPPLPYDAERLQKGMFFILDGVKMSLLLDEENKKLVLGNANALEITTEDTVSLLAEKAMAITTKDALNMTVKTDLGITADGAVNVKSKDKVEVTATTMEVK